MSPSPALCDLSLHNVVKLCNLGVCSMMRFPSLLLLGLCPCLVSVVMWSSWVCCGTLCGCVVDVTVMRILLIVYTERV